MTAPKILEKHTVYEGWGRYSTLRVRLPDGRTAKRELEEHGPAVAILPYDPVRKVAMLVRQFRAPVLAGGGGDTLLEAIAGLTDGEEGDVAARREAFEETGLQLSRLEPLGFLWTMPGLSTERMHLFLAAYGETDRIGKGGGVDGEDEIVVPVELPLAELVRMITSGDLADMKTFALLQSLRLHHPDLFDRRPLEFPPGASLQGTT